MLGNMSYLAILLFGLGLAMAQSNNDSAPGINSIVVSRPRAEATNFWTPERMQAAAELTLNVSVGPQSSGRSSPVASGPQLTVPAIEPDGNTPIARVLSARTRQTLTTGRVFWSCNPGSLSSCSAGVIPSTSGDVIVTAGHCVYDTVALRWMINCNWVFVPAYSNGNAPYGRWAARQVVALTSWTNSRPNYNYDVAFVALSKLNGKSISQVTGSQSLGFNQPRGQLTYSFGYPGNIANGQYLQSCSAVVAAAPYTINGYTYNGQGLRNCLMGGGCSGGPWLQRYNSATGVGVTYSVNSFTISSVPNALFGPHFDSNTQALWDYIKAR